jgi:hypothetical protein
MQVNNELPAHAGARQIENPPNQLLEESPHVRMDARTPSSAGASDPSMEAVGKSSGPRTPEGKASSARRGWKGGLRGELRMIARALRAHRSSMADAASD